MLLMPSKTPAFSNVWHRQTHIDIIRDTQKDRSFFLFTWSECIKFAASYCRRENLITGELLFQDSLQVHNTFQPSNQTYHWLTPLTCEEIGSPYLQLEVKFVVHGVDGLLLQQWSQPQMRGVGSLIVGTWGTTGPVPPKISKGNNYIPFPSVHDNIRVHSDKSNFKIGRVWTRSRI